jgi:tripartite-type tricarboxylate transporter receptor subunit TctC
MFVEKLFPKLKRFSLAAGFAVAAISAAVTASPVQAAFPDKPITILVGYGAGGMTDVSTRILAEKLEKILGVDIIVENKPGAGGTIAWAELLKRPSDGYTFVSFGSSAYVTAVMLERDIKLDDFAPIGSFMKQQRVLFARKDMPFKTLEEMVDYAKKTPVTFADGGAYWAARVVEAMSKQFDLKMRLVPFRSGSEGSAAILGGHVATAETGVGTGAWLGATKENKLNILATLSPGNLDEVGQPGIKSISDIGAKYLAQLYYGYAAKAGTPADRVKVLADAVEKALSDPDAVKKFQSRDLIPEWIPGDSYMKTLNGFTTEAKELKVYLGK